jgi:hypothetical protein
MTKTKMAKKIFVTSEEEMTEKWRKLSKAEIRNFVLTNF